LLFGFENEFQDVFDVAFHQDFILNRAILSEKGFILNHFEKFIGHESFILCEKASLGESFGIR
jgi:hypothetical protein